MDDDDHELGRVSAIMEIGQIVEEPQIMAN